MAVAFDDDAHGPQQPVLRAVPRLPTGEVDVRKITGIIAKAACPYCKGNLMAGHGEAACMMCARVPYILVLRPDGGVALAARGWSPPPQPSRAGIGAESRARRSQASDEGIVGLAARVLSAIPVHPGYAPISAIRSELRSRRMAVDNPQIRAALGGLIEAGLVVEVPYFAGALRHDAQARRIGYQRTDGAPIRAVLEGEP